MEQIEIAIMARNIVSLTAVNSLAMHCRHTANELSRVFANPTLLDVTFVRFTVIAQFVQVTVQDGLTVTLAPDGSIYTDTIVVSPRGAVQRLQRDAEIRPDHRRTGKYRIFNDPRKFNKKGKTK